MKKNIGITLLIALFIIPGALVQNRLSAQEWSPAQKEVWKVENDCWAAFAKGDQAGFLEFFSPDYMGWDDNSALPNNKTDTQKWFQTFMTGNKVLLYDIKPVGIKVFGDFAIVDYYYSLVNEMDGKKKAEDGRWTDILMKTGAKWLLIGDNGGARKNHED
jgi:ketosteroid isomerase-like protein